MESGMEQKEEELFKIFAAPIRRLLEKGIVEYDKLQEIRLRVQAPLLIRYGNREYYIDRDGAIQKEKENAYIVSKPDIKETVEYISNYSLYAYEEEIRQGFITVQGGHRVGMAGKVVME